MPNAGSGYLAFRYLFRARFSAEREKSLCARSFVLRSGKRMIRKDKTADPPSRRVGRVSDRGRDRPQPRPTRLAQMARASASLGSTHRQVLRQSWVTTCLSPNPAFFLMTMPSPAFVFGLTPSILACAT